MEVNMRQYLSLKNHVYNYISEKINEGSLHPDDKLNEVQISEELNVSRTPVREALIQLAADGYLENLPRRGFKVKKIDEKTAIEIYNIIGPLDGRAAYLSVDNITDRDIEQMEFLAASMDSAIEKSLFDKFYEIQLEFHNVYISKCDNEQLISLINQVKKTFIRKKYAIDENINMQEILKNTNSEHHKIIELFKARDKCGLQDYIRDIHWCKENAKFDTL